MTGASRVLPVSLPRRIAMTDDRDHPAWADSPRVRYLIQSPIAEAVPAAQSNQLYPKCRDGPSCGPRSGCGTPDTTISVTVFKSLCHQTLWRATDDIMLAIVSMRSDGKHEDSWT